MRVYWKDSRLRWNPEDFGNITSSRMSTDPSNNEEQWIFFPDIEYKENTGNGLFSGMRRSLA